MNVDKKKWDPFDWALLFCFTLIPAYCFGFQIGVLAMKIAAPPNCYPNWTCPSGKVCVELPVASSFAGFCVDPTTVTEGPEWRHASVPR